jgi:hypothetical protein
MYVRVCVCVFVFVCTQIPTQKFICYSKDVATIYVSLILQYRETACVGLDFAASSRLRSPLPPYLNPKKHDVAQYSQ